MRSCDCGEPIEHAPSVCKRKTLEEPPKGFSWNMTLGNCTKIWHYITVSNKRRKEQSFARRPTRISVLFRRVYLNIYRSVICMEQLCGETFNTHRTSRDHGTRDDTGGTGRVWRRAENYWTAICRSSTNTWTFSSSVECTCALWERFQVVATCQLPRNLMPAHLLLSYQESSPHLWRVQVINLFFMRDNASE
jgi:hypothetical protein